MCINVWRNQIFNQEFSNIIHYVEKHENITRSLVTVSEWVFNDFELRIQIICKNVPFLYHIIILTMIIHFSTKFQLIYIIFWTENESQSAISRPKPKVEV